MAEDTSDHTEGFICPDCAKHIQFETEEQLFKHWAEIHEGKTTSELSNEDNLVFRDHNFEHATWPTAKTCRYCGHLVWRSGYQCQYCRYVCHKRCREQAGIVSSCPGFRQATNALVQRIRKVVTGNKARYVTDFVDLDLTYITKRLIAMSFPATGLQATYRNHVKDVAALLKTKHCGKYMVFNVSEKEYDISKLDHQVLDFGWPDHMAPPLERLCSICHSMHSWLAADPENVVVVHCKGGKGRTGVVVASFLIYTGLFHTADDAMDLFAEKRFSTSQDSDKAEAGITGPSQRRLVKYFADLCDGRLKLIDRRLHVRRVTLSGSFLFERSGTARLFMVVYKEYTEEIYRTRDVIHVPTKSFVNVTLGSEFDIEGDVLIKVFHRSSTGRDNIVCRVQFHTCAVNGDSIQFSKPELDDAVKDKRVSQDAMLTLGVAPLADEKDVEESAVAAALLQMREKASDLHKDQLEEADAHAADSASDTIETGWASFDNAPSSSAAPGSDNASMSSLGSSWSSSAFQRTGFKAPKSKTQQNGSARRANDDLHHMRLSPTNPFALDMIQAMDDLRSRSTPSSAPASPAFGADQGEAEPGNLGAATLSQSQSQSSSGGEGDFFVPSSREKRKLRRFSSLSLADPPLQQDQRHLSLSTGSPPSAGNDQQKRTRPPGMPDMAGYDWFFGSMSTSAAETLLLYKADPGTFVVRNSDDGDPGHFVVSVRDMEGVVHVPVAWNRSRLQFQVSHLLFRSMQELLAYYQSHLMHTDEGRDVRLISPFGVHGLPAQPSSAPVRRVTMSARQRTMTDLLERSAIQRLAMSTGNQSSSSSRLAGTNT